MFTLFYLLSTCFIVYITIVYYRLRIIYSSSINTTKVIIITSTYKVLYNNKRKIPLGRRCR
jgi:hypothetical protein